MKETPSLQHIWHVVLRSSSPSLSESTLTARKLGTAVPEQLLTIRWDFVNSYREKEGRDCNAQWWNTISPGTICLNSLPPTNTRIAPGFPKQLPTLPRASHHTHFTDLTESSSALWQRLTATKTITFLANTPNQPDCKQWCPQGHSASWSFKMYWRWKHGLLSPKRLLCRAVLLHC